MFGNDKSRKNGLNIIVVGGGKVGATLVERLSREIGRASCRERV